MNYSSLYSLSSGLSSIPLSAAVSADFMVWYTEASPLPTAGRSALVMSQDCVHRSPSPLQSRATIGRLFLFSPPAPRTQPPLRTDSPPRLPMYLVPPFTSLLPQRARFPPTLTYTRPKTQAQPNLQPRPVVAQITMLEDVTSGVLFSGKHAWSCYSDRALIVVVVCPMPSHSRCRSYTARRGAVEAVSRCGRRFGKYISRVNTEECRSDAEQEVGDESDRSMSQDHKCPRILLGNRNSKVVMRQCSPVPTCQCKILLALEMPLYSHVKTTNKAPLFENPAAEQRPLHLLQ